MKINNILRNNLQQHQSYQLLGNCPVACCHRYRCQIAAISKSHSNDVDRLPKNPIDQQWILSFVVTTRPITIMSKSTSIRRFFILILINVLLSYFFFSHVRQKDDIIWDIFLASAHRIGVRALKVMMTSRQPYLIHDDGRGRGYTVTGQTMTTIYECAEHIESPSQKRRCLVEHARSFVASNKLIHSTALCWRTITSNRNSFSFNCFWVCFCSWTAKLS